MNGRQSATAFAPASVANVATGFDILGFAVDALGDRVSVRRVATPGVRITGASGVVAEVPLEPERNTAGRALQALNVAVRPPFGFEMHIEKGIPLGSGLGGSAASAVGAVVAANALLDAPLPKIELLKFAMQGEAVASGAIHADNISPSLFGGLVLTVGIDDPRVKRIPVPVGVRAVIVHPHMFLSTKQARSILKREVGMSDFVWQTANLAGFIAGCFTGDLELIREGLNDVVIEPQRRMLIPGATAVRDAALQAGALGCSISGAGPTLFAWAMAPQAATVCAAMVAAFARNGIEVDHWVVEIDSPVPEWSTTEPPMLFSSTRDAARRAGFGAALHEGLAPDGGLYVPERWPDRRAQIDAAPAGLEPMARWLLEPFVADDALGPELGAISAEAFNFPAPCVPLRADERYAVLELFHGPTAAFKDFGARFLAACFERLNRDSGRVRNILVATSGDTGGAVAAAFHRRRGMRITVLYPKGKVSPTQERQLTCWGDNVVSCAVRGTFDDCQALVKQAFVDPDLRARFDLSSANSINLGRLLPQAVYYAAASLECWRRHGEPLSFIVPSGNLGNVFACIAARQMGLPIGEIVLAHNANRTVVDFLADGQWRPRPSVATLASAMDVGAPSNMERLRHLFGDVGHLREAVRAASIDDNAIRARIRADASRYGRVWCPHTATAAEVYARLPDEQQATRRWCIVATAHPAKFPEIVEPLIGRPVEVPAALSDLLSRPTRAVTIDAELPALRAVLACAEGGA